MITQKKTVLVVAALALLGAISLVGQSAFADDQPGKGKGKGNSQKQESQIHDGGRSDGPGGGPFVSVDLNFPDADRRAIHDYYGKVAQSGKCPPGLAKKNNGCLPPGQAKKWAIGKPLPRDMIFFPIPPDLLGRISPPPTGHRYVRVGSDVLMIKTTTGLVAAAIENLARL